MMSVDLFGQAAFVLRIPLLPPSPRSLSGGSGRTSCRFILDWVTDSATRKHFFKKEKLRPFEQPTISCTRLAESLTLLL